MLLSNSAGGTVSMLECNRRRLLTTSMSSKIAVRAGALVGYRSLSNRILHAVPGEIEQSREQGDEEDG